MNRPRLRLLTLMSEEPSLRSESKRPEAFSVLEGASSFNWESSPLSLSVGRECFTKIDLT